jgi:ABC-2 type transport system permease protein
VRGFGAFLAKEAREIVRTWRIWVVPGMLVFFGLVSAPMAAAAPALVASLAGSTPGVVIQFPDPTALDAYAQFLKSLSQIVLIALIISGAGTISSERSTGTAILVLTKPLSRAAFVLAKLVAQLSLLALSTVVATAVCLGVTRLVFPAAPASPLLEAVLLWLVFAALLVAAMTLFSALLGSRGGAAGAGLGFLFLTLLASIWPAASQYSFVGLPGAAGAALTATPDFAWPVATAALTATAFTAAAIWIFRRLEI